MNASGRSATDAGVVLYAHGGGFADTEPRAERLTAYWLSTTTGRPVFAADYRLAPAHLHPAAPDDVVAFYRSLLDQGAPASRCLLFGESAGATRVLSALLTFKETGQRMPAGAILVSPLTDLTLSSPSLTATTTLLRRLADWIHERQR